MLKHQMQKRYTELSSRFEGGKEKEEISETKRTWFRPMRTVRERERRMQAGGDWASTNR